MFSSTQLLLVYRPKEKLSALLTLVSKFQQEHKEIWKDLESKVASFEEDVKLSHEESLPEN